MSMTLGIVGSEQAKFTSETEAKARATIRTLIAQYQPSLVVSGGCHLGGVDLYAEEVSTLCGVPFRKHLPKSRQWDGGYKQRNMLIAKDSDVVVCLTLKVLPPGYTGMRFKLCYHCGTIDHVKSGGCWTVKYAQTLGKEGLVMVI